MMLKSLYVMLQFLTTFPLRRQIAISTEQFGKALVFAPFVGLILGCMLVGICFLFQDVFSLPLLALFLLLFYIVCTGALHVDGVADTFDAVFSRRSRDKMLEIMQDSRIGTMGVLAVLFLVAFDVLLMRELLDMPGHRLPASLWLIGMPVAGRIGSVTCVALFPYARAQGMAKSFSDYCNKKQLLLALGMSLIIFCLVWGPLGILFCGTSFVGALLISLYFSRKLGGITGDVAGAVCELNQLLFLAGVYFCEKMGGFA